MELQNKVDIIFTGYSRDDEGDSRYMRANCTCTLVRCHTGRNIIVDTMTAWDGARLQSALKDTYSLSTRDINAVVCTHGHSDHIGCNYLFCNALWHVVGRSVSNGDRYYMYPLTRDCDSFQLSSDYVTVQPTPGHTLDSVSVIVHKTQDGIVGICGDLFEREEDIEKPALWLEAGSEDEQMQRKQRLRMAELCNMIVPGHGKPFMVTPQIRETLRRQLSESEAQLEAQQVAGSGVANKK